MGILSSIFRTKCPRCRKGDLFEKPFSFSNAFKMPDHCPVCDQDYFPEPGFYYGAMFIGYGITAWTFFLLGAILIFLLDMNFNKAIVLIVIFAALTFVYFFRLARSVWIHIYVKYDPKSALRNEAQS